MKFNILSARPPPPVTVLTNLLDPSGFRTDPSGQYLRGEKTTIRAGPEYLDEFSSTSAWKNNVYFPGLGHLGAAVNDRGQVFFSLINGGSVTLLEGCGTSALRRQPLLLLSLPRSPPLQQSHPLSPKPLPPPPRDLHLTPTATAPTGTPTPPDVACDQSYAYPNPVSGNTMKIHLQLCDPGQTTF